MKVMDIQEWVAWVEWEAWDTKVRPRRTGGVKYLEEKLAHERHWHPGMGGMGGIGYWVEASELISWGALNRAPFF